VVFPIVGNRKEKRKAQKAAKGHVEERARGSVFGRKIPSGGKGEWRLENVPKGPAGGLAHHVEEKTRWGKIWSRTRRIEARRGGRLEPMSRTVRQLRTRLKRVATASRWIKREKGSWKQHKIIKKEGRRLKGPRKKKRFMMSYNWAETRRSP